MVNQIWTHTYKLKYGCNTCIESKLTCQSFKFFERKTKPLGVIHTNLCDMKLNPSKGGNKYFMTFIDDCTKLWMSIYLKVKMKR